MKQRLLNLMATLSLLVAGAMLPVNAQTTVNVSLKPATNGTFSTGATVTDYYTTWTSNASSGLVGLTITTSGNLGMCEQNVSSYGGNLLAFKTTTSNTDEDIVITAPVGFVITNYALTARLYASASDGYTLTDHKGDSYTINVGGNNVDVTVDGQSSVTLKLRDTKGLSTNYLCVTSMTVTLKPVSFKLNCARGYVKGNGTALSGTSTAADASEFVLVPYQGNTYLYDATNNAFVKNNATEIKIFCSDLIRNIVWGNTEDSNYPYYLQDESTTNWLNMDGTHNVFINTWKTIDDGNKYKIIIENPDFDYAEAVSLIDFYNNPDIFSAYYGEKWVRILGANNTNIAMGISSAENGENVAQKSRADGDEGQIWCLVGDANSFKMYNKMAGTTLQLASNSTAVAPGIGTQATMRNPDVSGTDWRINNWLAATDGPGWGIFYAGSNGTMSLNASGGYSAGGGIAYWYNSTNNGGSHWLFEPVTVPSDPSGLENNSVYALYCAYSDGAYPLYNNNGVPNVSDNTSTTPQLFVLSESGKILSDAYPYNLRKAEGDGYLAWGDASSNRQSIFSTTDKGDYLFLNSSSTLPDGASAAGTMVGAPYFHFYGWYEYGGSIFYPAFRGPYSGVYIVNAKTDAGANNVYGTTETKARTAANQYNYRWNLVKQSDWVVYTLLVRDESGNKLDDVLISYENASDAAIERSAQTNGGFFVISNDVTPVQSMFSISDVRYKISAFSLSGTTITVTLASLAVTTVTEGRYVIWNRGRSRWLVQANDAINRAQSLGAFGDNWNVVPTAVTGQYLIRNEQNNGYIKWTDDYNTNFSLVTDPSEATPVVFSASTDDVVQSGCVAIKNANITTDAHFHMAANGPSAHLVRWRKEDASDWMFYPVEYVPEENVEYLIVNKQSSKYATRGANDDAQLVQNARGYVDYANSVWTLTADGTGYKFANGGSSGKFLANVTGSETFTTNGITWYIKEDPTDNTYFNIANREDIDGENHNLASCWNNDGETGQNIALWTANGNPGSMWRFVPVDIYYANALAYLASLYSEKHKNDLFYLTETAYNSLRNADHATTEKTINSANAMYNVLNNPDNLNMPSGRYLVRNCNYDYNEDLTVDDKETYLTSLSSLMGVVEKAVGYWSIWDVEHVSGWKYNIRNEGHRYILTPKHTMAETALARKDDGYLYYDSNESGNSKYKVGNATGTGEIKELSLFPAMAFHPEDKAGGFAAIGVEGRGDAYMLMNAETQTNGDHLVEAAGYTVSASYQWQHTRFLWQFIPVKSENETNDEGTHSGESEMFANQVNGLAGYVGGVVTLDNVMSVPCLNDIVLLRDATVSALDDNTALNYESTYDGQTTTFAVGEGGAKAYEAIIAKIYNIKTSADENVSKLYQDLRPTENPGEENEKDHPFFLENMCGSRPEYGGRLTEYSETLWHTDYKANVVDAAGAFYVTRKEYNTDGYDYKYVLNNKNNDTKIYLKHGNMNTYNESICRTTVEDEALNFVLEPVIPGVWQMKDINPGSGSYGDWVWVSVTGYRNNSVLMYYNKVEVSTLWKFSTFNELDSIYLKQTPGEAQNGYKYFSTFSYPLNVKIPKYIEGSSTIENPVPYHCTRAELHSKTEATLNLVFTALEPVTVGGNDYYFLTGREEGYLFLQSSVESGDPRLVDKDKDASHENCLFIANASFVSGAMPERPDGYVNLMKANLETTYITNENWTKYYALAYKTGRIGSYHGTPVNGVGMGFYHLQPGSGKMNPLTGYINRTSFTDLDDTGAAAGVHESVIPAEIWFEDADGNLVDKIVVQPDGSWQSVADGPIYDLTGRRVEKPMHGVYIQNGKKVMYK